MNKEQFSATVFSRKVPDNFEAILQFQAMPRMTKDMRQHMFVSGLIFHALDNTSKHEHDIPYSLFNADFNLHHVIQNL